jgi:hypothetical protein
VLIKFTQHSLDRLEERTSLSIYELENIYKAQKTVPLGIEPSSNRQHDLFYSLLDDECYVGVRDVRTHELITILPISYHKVWKISQDAEYLAMELSMQSSA